MHPIYIKPAKPISPYEATEMAKEYMSASKEFDLYTLWMVSKDKTENEYNEFTNDGKKIPSWGIPQMQVKTGKDVARWLHEDPNKITDQWFKDHPIESIRYGIAYFRMLLNYFHSYYWATRAYNGGWGYIKMARRGTKRWKHLAENYYTIVQKHCGELEGN